MRKTIELHAASEYGNQNDLLNEYANRYIGTQTYWGHDLDLSRSRDVIVHVMIRFSVCDFLLVVHRNRASLSKRKAFSIYSAPRNWRIMYRAQHSVAR